MEIYLDTANINEIKKVMEIIDIDGITTNPSLIAKEHQEGPKRPKNSLIYTISNIIELDLKINVEILSTTPKEALEEINTFTNELIAVGNVMSFSNMSDLRNTIIFKVPITTYGLQIIKHIRQNTGYETNATLVFTPLQALLASRAGADYISIFVGRIDDKYQYGTRSSTRLQNIIKIFKNYDIDTKVIVASIRNVRHIEQAALAGADIVTVPPEIINRMIHNSLTDEGVKRFEDDWNNSE